MSAGFALTHPSSVTDITAIEAVRVEELDEAAVRREHYHIIGPDFFPPAACAPVTQCRPYTEPLLCVEYILSIYTTITINVPGIYSLSCVQQHVNRPACSGAVRVQRVDKAAVEYCYKKLTRLCFAEWVVVFTVSVLCFCDGRALSETAPVCRKYLILA